jgi:hypothetical protein
MADMPSLYQPGEYLSVPAEQTPGAEQRAHPRYACGTVTLTRVSLTATDITYFAWVHDISAHGIGLDVLAPLNAGTDIVFDLKRGGEDARIRLYAQVIHATPIGPFFRLGCKLTRPLRPWMLANLLHKTREAGQAVTE